MEHYDSSFILPGSKGYKCFWNFWYFRTFWHLKPLQVAFYWVSNLWREVEMMTFNLNWEMLSFLLDTLINLYPFKSFVFFFFFTLCGKLRQNRKMWSQGGWKLYMDVQSRIIVFVLQFCVTQPALLSEHDASWSTFN